jgi:hypothetical protein
LVRPRRQKPSPKAGAKAFSTCAKLLPVASANAVTGNVYALTKVKAQSSSHSVYCEYDNADWPGPQGTAGAFSFGAQVASPATRKAFARVEAIYAKAAARDASTGNCQPGYQPAPLADQCELVHPFGASSVELSGYLFVLTDKYFVNVARGGADYTPEGLQAIARTVIARLH